MQLWVAALFVVLLGLLPDDQPHAIQLTNQTMQLKSGNMLGSVGITIAQWDLEFDEDLYYFEAPGCAPGLTRQNLTAAAVASNPCWAGCDFTSPDPDECGQPFNTGDPSCQAVCDAHPRKSTLCDYTNRPWTVIEPEVESPLFAIAVNEVLRLRFNWLRVEQGFRYSSMPTLGPLSITAQALMDLDTQLSGGHCLTRTSPACYSNLCPSFQCFDYGTWEFGFVIAGQSTVTNYIGTSSHVIRSFPAPPANATRLTSPRSDAPTTYQQQYGPLHTPLQFGVPVEAHFKATDTSLFYQLTTPYCGFISIQHEKAVWDRPTCRVAVTASTDGEPYPSSLFSDIMFIDGAIKPLWICPRPPETTSVVYFGVFRYIGTGEPAITNPEMHYLTVDYHRSNDGWRQYRLGSNASESGFSNHTNFPPLANWAQGLAANLFRLSCPSPDDPLTTVEYFDCRAGSSTHGTCNEFLFGVPVEPWTISLLPIPTEIVNINPESFSNIEYPAFQPTASKKLSAFLILELTSDGSLFSQTLGSDWRDLWSQCVLHVGPASPIGSQSADWLFADLALDETVPRCVYSEFEQLSQLITAGIESMTNDPLSAYSERVLIDEMTFHDPWQACNTFIASQLSVSSTTEVTLFSTMACLDSSATSDPCCNNELSWTQCCAPREIVASVDELVINQEATNATCHHNQCVEPFLEMYSFAYLADSVGGCNGPELNTRLRAPLRVYRNCREAAFGDDFQLPSCVIDSDCTDLGANTSTYCNQVTRQCAFNFSDSVSYFFECIADNLPIESRIKLIARNNFTVTDEMPLASQLQQRYGTTSKCVDQSFGSPWSLYNSYLETGGMYGGCSVCHRLASDVSYQPPPWCEVGASAFCGYEWDVQPSTVGCESLVCNWDQSDQCNTSLAGTPFCAVCETDAICMEVSDAQLRTDCDAIDSVCFLANGTIRTDLTEKDCSLLFSCTLLCEQGSACTKKETCEAIGYCQTDDEIYEAMEAVSWNTVTTDGFCALPMEAFNSPECGATHIGALPTSYGCVVFGDCIGLTASLNCTPNYFSEELCLNLSKAVWWPRFDEASCLSKQGCNEELLGIESLSSLGTRLRSPKDKEQCELCEGKVQPLSSWESGRWLPGSPRKARWIDRAMVVRYSLADSIDFNALYDDIYTSSRAAVAFQLQNNIQCSYQTINSLLLKITCACTTDLTRRDCFPGDFVTSVGVGEVCPLTSNTIIAPPTTLSYTKDSVSSELQNQCVEFTISRINSRFFYSETPPPITTGLVPKFTVRGWNAVVNEWGATVGQVIGDGIWIQFTQNGLSLTELIVCALISTNIPLSNQSESMLYGLGYGTGATNPATVLPYQGLTNVSLQFGFVCANIQMPRTGEDISFVPIYYRADWQDQLSARFSSGQKALLYIVATLYAILCVAILVQVVRIVFWGAWDFNIATNYIWVLLLFMTIIRAVYIYLVAADVLGQQNKHLLVDFWMMDLPTLIYLICNSTIAMSFLFLLLATKQNAFRQKRYFWITLLGLIALIVTIFVAILLAFNYAVVDTQGSHGPVLCSSYTDNSSSATAIRIVYECLLFTIALLIAIIGGVFACRLWWDLRTHESKISLLALGCVSSFGILSDSLAYLIYYIVNNPTPYFAIVLIFTEILPITFLVVSVSTKQISNVRTSNSSPRQGSSGRPGSSFGPTFSSSPSNSMRED